MEIGNRIRALRLANGLTQEELAVRAGLTKGFISLLERDKSSISLEALVDVLGALGTELAEFFSEDARVFWVTRKRDRVQINEEGVRSCEMLIPASSTLAMDPYLVALAPTETLGPNRGHSGEKIGFVLKGKLRITVGKRGSTVNAGDCFAFMANYVHSIANEGNSEAELLLITCPPQR